MMRKNLGILIAVVVLVFLLFALVAVAINIEPLPGPTPTDAVLVVLLAVALIGTVLFVAYLAWYGPAACGATLQGTALWVPWTAALASTALYLASTPEQKFLKDNALLVGSGLAAALWLLYALVDGDYPTAGRQSPGWHGLLKGSIEALRLRATETSATCPDPNAATIRQHVAKNLDQMEKDLSEPGLRWVTRAGFNAAWTDYHRADEALIGIDAMPTLIDVAISDLLRLDGSEIKGRAALVADLHTALTELDPKIEPYVSALVPKDAKPCADDSGGATKVAKPVEAAAPASPGLCARLRQCLLALMGKGGVGSPGAPSTNDANADASACEAERRSRTVIQTIHRSLNTYRGSRWAELGRARWQLMVTTTVAGIVAFLVLALALIQRVEPSQLVAGWAYFLVGAAAGLFLRLALAAGEYQVSDDYGLETARVYQTPLLSGMAAVMGVVLMASIAGSSLGDILTPAPDTATPAAAASTSPETAASSAPASPSAAPSPASSGEATASASPAPASTQATTATLSDAFSLGDYPIGIVLALAFGLTPNLVLRRLGVSITDAKKQLLATRPT